MQGLSTKFLQLVTVLLISGSSFASLTTVNLSTGKDAHVNTKLPSTNFGSDTLLDISTHIGWLRGSWEYSRGFLEFDLSSIPSNAEIYSAKIKLNISGSISGSVDWYTKLVTSDWVESTITANGQPDISTLTGDISSDYTNYGSYILFDVTSMTQRLVVGQISNYGWSIQLANESYQGVSGGKFYSSECTVSGLRPVLEIQYYIPLSLTNISVLHESASGASDGEVSYGVSGGASSTYTYTWINGATGAQISSTPNSSSPVPLTGQSYGWYGLSIQGDQYGETLYQAFIIGLQCEEVSIAFQPDGNYTSNAYIINQVQPGYDTRDYNYGNSGYFRTDNWYYSTSGWYDTKSFLKFHLWMDPQLLVNQADMTLYGWSHIFSGTTNESELLHVTSNWNENYVTWNTSPSVSTSIMESIPSTPASNSNSVIDIKEHWDEWKANNASNYGVQLRLQNFDDDYNTRQLYYSPTSSASVRPLINFSIEIRDEYSCSENYFFYLKEEVEQSIAYVPGNKLRFKFHEDYFDASGNLNYTITRLEDDSQQSGTLTKNHLTNWCILQNGIGGVTLISGKIYLLEVVNTKGQKAYLKFKMS